MRLFILFALLLINVFAFYFPNGTQYNVPVESVNDNWQLCSGFSTAATNTLSLEDVDVLCPGDYIMFTCTHPLYPTLFSVAAWGLKTDVIMRTPLATPSGSNGTLWYQTNSTLESDSNSTTNCTELTGDAFCMNIAPRGSTYVFQPGAYCGAVAGFQQQLLVNIGIYAIPCYNLASGTSCLQPGVINCGSNGTCQGNISCLGASLNPPPTFNSSLCIGPVACNLVTGNYSVANLSIGAPCDLGDGCFTNDVCNGYGVCEHAVTPILPCAPNNNSCLNLPTCFSGGGPSYTCTYAPFPNGTVCAYDNSTLCRTGDACFGGVCIEGAAQLGPPPDPCMFNATCDPATGFFNVTGLPDGSSCIPANPCTTNGTCLNYRCSNSVPTIAPPPPNICQVASTCNVTNGEWTYVSNNSGGTCPVDACTYGFCFFGNCSSFQNITCNSNNTNPCLQSVCVPPSTGCVLVPVADGTPCDANLCSTGGTCLSGTCVGSLPLTCQLNPEFSPNCTAPSCSPTLGCLLNPFPSGTPCEGTCIAPGIGECSSVGTCIGPYIPNCVNGTVISSAKTLHSFLSYLV